MSGGRVAGGDDWRKVKRIVGLCSLAHTGVRKRIFLFIPEIYKFEFEFDSNSNFMPKMQ